MHKQLENQTSYTKQTFLDVRQQEVQGFIPGIRKTNHSSLMLGENFWNAIQQGEPRVQWFFGVDNMRTELLRF